MKILLTVQVALLVAVSALAAQPQLEAVSASADTKSGLLKISGVSFDNGTSLEVTLGGFGALAVMASSDILITALLPPGVEPGTYTVFITTSDGTIRFDEIEVTIGVVGRVETQGEVTPQGPEGRVVSQNGPGSL